jgi:hypothetical protein
MTTSSRVPTERLAMSYGIFIGIALIAYFLLMHIMGLTKHVELRYFNLVIVMVAVVMAIRHLKRAKHGMINYLEGLGLGFATAAVGAIIFMIFFFIFINLISPDFLNVLRANENFPAGEGTMAMLVIAMVILLECLVAGFFTAFIAMQLLKRPDHKTE